MANHRRQNTTVARNIAAVTAVAAGAAVLAPTAGAAEVRVPDTAYSIDVPNIETVPGIQNVPNVDRWIPSLSSQDAAVIAAPAAPEAPVVEFPTPVQSAGEQIVEIARTKIGSPYVYGASGPSAFDCSGFTSWVYAQAGKSIPRTSQAQASAGTPVPLDQLQAGDIVAYYGGASHVGIYTGHGTIIDALNDGVPVGERPLDMMPIHSAVRF